MNVLKKVEISKLHLKKETIKHTVFVQHIFAFTLNFNFLTFVSSSAKVAFKITRHVSFLECYSFVGILLLLCTAS
jgi:hypothetical protein